MGLVGRADLDQLDAAGGHHLGQTERAADPRPIAPRETITSRPAPSVDNTIIVAAALLLTTVAASAPGELLQQPLDPAVALAAGAGLDVGLKDRVAGQLLGDLTDGRPPAARPGPSPCGG